MLDGWNTEEMRWLPPQVGTEWCVVPYAHVEEVRRNIPTRASVGDWARARLAAGTVAFLEMKLQGTVVPLGAAYQAPYNVPFGLAATAAYAVVAPAEPPGGYWTGRDVDVEWYGQAGFGDELVATATIVAIDAGVACLDVSACTAVGRALLRGTLRLSAVRDGKALPTSLVPRGRERPEVLLQPRPGSYLVAEVQLPPELLPGQCAEVGVTVVNMGEQAREVELAAKLPPGHGLGLPGGDRRCVTVLPGASARLGLPVRADRPHEVNLGAPWPLRLTVTAGCWQEDIVAPIRVADPEPGRLLYVLTEDCETFDGGPATGDYGEREVLGNHNNFMDPEDYLVQMVAKPERMNAIAERHGACWTHFFTVPQRFAAAWAAERSPTGAWRKVVERLDETVRQGAARHEYAPHLHCDYEPDSALPPQPRLVYDPHTDGILPNEYYDPVTNPEHRYHDWDGSARGGPGVKKLGDLHTLDSKTGSLYKSLHFLARLQAGQRLPLVARIGSFDFGKDTEDQRTSTRAFEACGLRGSSDLYLAWLPPRQGGQMFWCRAEDRAAVVESLEQVCLAQLAICHDTDFSNLEADQKWFAQAVEAARGPGVRVLMSMTHAMFMRGEPDPFRSLDGGSFANLDQFLGWVREHYPEVHFATASEALIEYLDYYSPQLAAVVSPTPCAADESEGRYEFPVRLLGQGIYVGPEAPATIRVVVPPVFDPAEIAWARVLDGQTMLAELTAPGAERQPYLEVKLSARSSFLRLVVQVRPEAAGELARCFQAAPAPRFVEPREPRRQPLFRLAPPREGCYTADLLRLLMNPVAGHPEPLGRRLHPLGVLAMGICLTEALAGERSECRGDAVPVRLKLRWRKAIPLDATMWAKRARREDGSWVVRVRDHSGAVICDAQVWTASSPPRASVLLETPVEAAQCNREAALQAGVQAFASKYEEALRVYRSLRGWKLMLAVHKGHALARQGIRPLLAWLWQVVRGRPELETHELQFPNIHDYLR